MWQDELRKWEQTLSKNQKRAQGSIWTPPKLAKSMSKWLLEIKPSSVFDPAAGSGNLLEPFEIEKHAAEQDEQLRKVLEKRFGIKAGEDFWLDEKTYPAITANPPYINHAKINNKDELHHQLKIDNISLPKNTNLALLFYAKCWQKLEDNGRMIFLMPTEFMQTKSGEPFKSWLLSTGVRLIVDLEDNGLFEDAISTACLVLSQKDDYQGPVGFYQAAETDLNWKEIFTKANWYQRDKLDPAKRWRQTRSLESQKPRQKLSDIADVYPGTITGANDFFLVDKQTAKSHDLSVRYCLIRPQNLSNKRFHKQNQDDSRNQWLVTISQPSEKERAYLDQGLVKEFDKRPTMKSRDPWYKQEDPIEWDFVIGNFRRKEYLITLAVENNVPIRVDWAAIPNRVKVKDDLALALFGWLSSESGQKALRTHERHAGNGLFTLRSGALKQTPVPFFSPEQKEEMGKLVREWMFDETVIEKINLLAESM